ncbi:MAG: OsmC family protein [Bacteroidota bacterium]
MNIKILFDGNKKVNAYVNDFEVKTDQPVPSGGDGSAPDPFTVFLTSLGACAGIFVKTFCDQRDIPTEHIHLEQEVEFDHLKKLLKEVVITIFVPKDFPEKYDEAVIHAANTCLVKRHLRDEVIFRTLVKREE